MTKTNNLVDLFFHNACRNYISIMKFSLLCLVLIQTNILTSSENKAKKSRFFFLENMSTYFPYCALSNCIFFSLGQCYWSYCKLLSSSLMLRRSFFVDSWTPFNRFNSSGVIHRKRHSKAQFHLWRVGVTDACKKWWKVNA